MSQILNELDQRFSSASSPCRSLITGEIQYPGDNHHVRCVPAKRRSIPQVLTKKPTRKPTAAQKACAHDWRLNGFNGQLKQRRYCPLCDWREVVD